MRACHSNPLPEGYHTHTVKGAKAALDFYQRAFGAEILHSMERSDGKVMAEIERRGQE